MDPFTAVLHPYSILTPLDRKAIRYNILVNPSGKPHQFRAVDWVLELINLYIKVRVSHCIEDNRVSLID